MECYGRLASAYRSSVGSRLVTAVPLGCWHCGNAAVGFARNLRCLVCMGAPMVGAHRHLPGHGSALGPLALLECGGQLRTVCALLGGCVCLWSAHNGTRLVTGSALGPLALLECGGQLRTECALHGVCVPMVGAHRHSSGHGQCPWAAGIVGMRRSASLSMCVAWWVCVPMVGAHRHLPGHAQCP